MFRRPGMAAVLFFSFSLAAIHAAQGPALDDSPAQPGEWGFRPFEGSETEVNPPAFSWRPQKGATTYVLECSPTPDFSKDVYRVEGIWLNVHCPPRVFKPGAYHWRYAFVDEKGQRSAWSKVRAFTIPQTAVEFPMPPMQELIARIPKGHPRLFLRPEDLGQLKKDIEGPLKERWAGLRKEADRLAANPPPSDEPLKYEPGWKRGSAEWLARWWGNREKVIRTLNGAATLAFVYMVTGEKKYGEVARKLMLDAAAWDPKGSTNHYYNDEASMPVVYYMSRAYTWGYGALSEADRAKIRASMTVRGQDIFSHLRRSPHTWRPYDSHHNRAWHKLGELAIAFMGEIDECPMWLEHTVNTFFCCYPVWSDDDGGWHEGASYWSSHQYRHTWWLDVMKSALGIDGFKKPFFHRAGYFPLYAMPPGTECGGFGDLALERTPRAHGSLMTIFARGAQNGHWQWYADQVGGEIESGYLGLLRAQRPAPKPQPPTDLPSSKVFRGTGLAMLHTNLLDATKDVQVFFKSSPMGSQSHGFNAQNSFILAVYGKPLLISSGRRDWHGSPHHTQWMWETKSQNNILVNGKGQIKHTRTEVGGKITAFHTSGEFDYVVGDASATYGEAIRHYTRTILFAKPDIILIYDQLDAAKPSTFSWLLHAIEAMRFKGQSEILVSNGASHARVSIVQPTGLKLSQHDKFDPPPQKWPGWKQYHFAAETTEPRETIQFITVIRPYGPTAGATGGDKGALPPAGESVKRVPNGWLCEIRGEKGTTLEVLLRTGEAGGIVAAGIWKSDSECAVRRVDAGGKVISTFTSAKAIRF